MPDSTESLIIGGGVVGLSLAYELAGRGLRTTLIDRQAVGREASWAGAGILPPCSWYSNHSALDDLAVLSSELNSRWSAELHESTGIDNEFRLCGGTYLAPNDAQLAAVAAIFDRWKKRGIEVEPIDSTRLRKLEPALGELPHRWAATRGGFHIPEEGQIRNPRHVAALAAACLARGVDISAPCRATSLRMCGESITHVATDQGPIACDHVILAAGAWSFEVAEIMGFRLPVHPVRGQMILYPAQSPSLLVGNLHAAGHYAVPRRDGRVLVGATVENVGFDKSTTAGAVESLANWTSAICKPLAERPIERVWAGLRPATPDGLPYIGPVARYSNLWVAAGHFRAGLQFASATAAVLADLVTGQPALLDLHPFRIAR